MQRFLDKSDPRWQVTGLAIEYVNLQSLIQGDRLPWSKVINQLSALDNKFREQGENMPSLWLSSFADYPNSTIRRIQAVLFS